MACEIVWCNSSLNVRVEGIGGVGTPGNICERVVGEVFSDTWEVYKGLDANGSELLPVSNTRVHQSLSGANGTQRKNDLLCGSEKGTSSI